MAAPSRKDLSAAVLLLLVVTAAAWMRAESAASVGDYGCSDHLSGNYKGACWSWFDDDGCKRVCVDESSDNDSGFCAFFQCWCHTRCTPEIAAAASAPTPA